MRSAIILAGGFGRRLRSEISDVPKPMALINGIPFLEYLLNKLEQEGFEHAVLAVGYKYEIILRHFGSAYRNLQLSYSIENEPLGTGGALAKALGYMAENQALVVNGDTFVQINYGQFFIEASGSNKGVSLCAVYLQDASRYGTILFGENNLFYGFEEKKSGNTGYINSGIYQVNKKWLLSRSGGFKFSFEKDILQRTAYHQDFTIHKKDGFFIDIGIPEDYHYLDFLCSLVSNNWTLFLDRDGTINNRIHGDYVRSWKQFEWSDGALEAIGIFSNHFRKIIIVTNQQGIGKGLMSTSDLHDIHSKMVNEIKANGGNISKIYYCPDLKTKPCNCRKPNIDMGLWAKRDFPEIDYERSVMIGDMPSDIVFGKRLGMKIISLGHADCDADFRKDTLIDFAKDLEDAPTLS